MLPQIVAWTLFYFAANNNNNNNNATFGGVTRPPAARYNSLLRASTQQAEEATVATSANANDNNDNDNDDSSSIIPSIVDAKDDRRLEAYKKLHKFSIEHPEEFWNNQALEHLDWFTPFTNVKAGTFEHGDIRWFENGKLNMCYNAIDRHVNAGKGNDLAMIWEGDEPDDVRKITFSDLQRKVSQIANALKASGVKKGDVVTIYMPMIPELAMTMLACTRIGAVHSVVFAGFSAEALAQRISAAKSKFIVTADIGKRGSKTIPLKNIVNDSLTKMNCQDIVQQVLVWERFFQGSESEPPYEMQPTDVRMDLLVASQRPYCPPEPMDSEDNLFILYTSGSTGKPKGLVHTTAGYALYAKLTTLNTFALQQGDVFACVADCGWITGHTYVVYGPLLNAVTTFLFESTPVYPNEGRYWDMVQRHQITQFYTAPTAIRLLMKYGTSIFDKNKYDLSSLKVLGTVGEPINPGAWRWYYQVVGKSKVTIVDTYWQTETGGHVITNLPGITPMKPGSCTLPFYGVDTVVLDAITGQELPHSSTEPVEGVMAIKQPWPGMARTCLDDHERYMSVYLQPYKGYYFTGDTVMRDTDGYHFIIGRMDDVINVSGHRIGTAEIESVLVANPAVAQAAVVGQPHEIKGQSICAFCMLSDGYTESSELLKELRNAVRSDIGAFCSPDLIIICPSLPMTRSGKIMRRILRKIVCDETDTLGDTSTLADPSIVDTLITKVGDLKKKK